MKLIRPLLAIAGFALFGVSATLAVYEAFVAFELEKVFPRRPAAKVPDGVTSPSTTSPGTSRH